MDNNILEFLEAYKSFDELCKQILSSNQGVTEYINEMKVGKKCSSFLYRLAKTSHGVW